MWPNPNVAYPKCGLANLNIPCTEKDSWNQLSPLACAAIYDLLLLFCHGHSGLVVRASDYYSGLGFKSQMVPELFLWIISLDRAKFVNCQRVAVGKLNY